MRLLMFAGTMTNMRETRRRPAGQTINEPRMMWGAARLELGSGQECKFSGAIFLRSCPE